MIAILSLLNVASAEEPLSVGCTDGLCVVSRARDSDGDGWTDVDETHCGTDPHDPTSRPMLLTVLEVGVRELPSIREGLATVLILPTTGPDGRPLFGGPYAIPSRESTLDKLGIEVPDGVDLTQGLSLVFGAGGTSVAPVGVHAIDTTGGGSGLLARIAGLVGSSPGTVTTAQTTVHGSTTIGGGRVDHEDGTVELGWSTDGTTSVVRARVTTGDDGTVATSTSTSTVAGDTKTTTAESNDGKGNTSSTIKSTTTLPDGTRTTFEVTKTSDGKNTTTTTTHTTQTSSNGKTETITSTRVETCTGDDCTTTDNVQSSTVCEPGVDGCDDQTDPDYVAFVPSPEEVGAALAMLGSNIRFASQPEIGEPDDTRVPGRWDLVSLVVETGDEVMVLEDAFWNEALPELVRSDFRNPLAFPPDEGCLYCGH